MKKRDGIRKPSQKPVKMPTNILDSSATGHQLEYRYAILACCNTTPKTKRKRRLSKKVTRFPWLDGTGLVVIIDVFISRLPPCCLLPAVGVTSEFAKAARITTRVLISWCFDTQQSPNLPEASGLIYLVICHILYGILPDFVKKKIE